MFTLITGVVTTSQAISYMISGSTTAIAIYTAVKKANKGR